MPKTRIAESTATRTGIIAAVLMIVGIFGALAYLAKNLPAAWVTFDEGAVSGPPPCSISGSYSLGGGRVTYSLNLRDWGIDCR